MVYFISDEISIELIIFRKAFVEIIYSKWDIVTEWCELVWFQSLTTSSGGGSIKHMNSVLFSFAACSKLRIQLGRCICETRFFSVKQFFIRFIKVRKTWSRQLIHTNGANVSQCVIRITLNCIWWGVSRSQVWCVFSTGSLRLLNRNGSTWLRPGVRTY